MQDFLKRLPAPAEIVIVLGVAFGWTILGSLQTVLDPELVLGRHHTGWTILYLGIFESGVLVLLGLFLRARDWTPKQLGLSGSPVDAVAAIGLAVAMYAAYVATFIVVAIVLPGVAAMAAQVQVVSGSVPLATALIVSAINGLFEELFVCAYTIAALQKAGRSAWFAINVSVAIRLSYHLYQGPLGVIGIVPMGLISAYWYTRTNRLWPLIGAHAVIDLVGFMMAPGTGD
jgi:membrane protease YdiL (CAAX protease family)